MSNKSNIRIVFFIGSLRSGGKERRLIELLTFLKKESCYEMLLVMTKNEIHYQSFYELGIPCHIMKKESKKDVLNVFFQFYKVCNQFKPNILHTWGRIQTFYALPSVILNKFPLINSQITAAPPKRSKFSYFNFIDKVNFHFSKFVLANSKAGIAAYKPPMKKSRVIYNGLNFSRILNLLDKDTVKLKYRIHTPYTVIMAASFTQNKDYNLFYNVAEFVCRKRDDITFIGVGGYSGKGEQFKDLVQKSKNNKNILFPGRIDDVEALINASTIGVLFSNEHVHGEGISNAIMEYMALSKPVIANDAGGTKEILHHNQNGYLIKKPNVSEISLLVEELIDNEGKRNLFGERSKQIINDLFTIDRMGEAFEDVYREVV